MTIPSHEVRAGARLWRRLLVLAAVGQAVSSAVVSVFGGAFTTADRAGEPLIVPPGGTFIIWNVIIALSIGYAIWAEPDQRPNLALRNRLARPLLVTCIGFSVWLAAAELEPIWSTLVVFLIMLAALLRALTYAQEERATIRAWSPLAQGLLWGTLGLYTGWSSVAVWLNLSTALVGSGLPITTPAAIVGQAAILAGAVGTAVAITWFTPGLLPYVAAVTWALGGAIVSTIQEGYPVFPLVNYLPVAPRARA
ncbi:MAG: hypothetical protein ACJ72M_12300 [Propionibacteriaceae bacterium]